MRACLLLLLLAAHAGGALAQYKCTASNGAVTFQQSPCVGARSGQKLDIVPNGHPPGSASAAASGNVDQRMLANYQRQDRHDALAKALRTAQDDAARRQAQHEADVAALRRRFAQQPPEGLSLAAALASLDSRYRALAMIDDDRVRAAQAALAAFDQANPPPAR